MYVINIWNLSEKVRRNLKHRHEHTVNISDSKDELKLYVVTLQTFRHILLYIVLTPGLHRINCNEMFLSCEHNNKIIIN